MYFITLLVILSTFNYIGFAQNCGFDQSTKIGSATYYHDYDKGACSFGPLNGATGPGTPYIAALSQSFFNDAQMCGVCFQIFSPYNNNTITVYSTDLCPSGGICSNAYHFDLSEAAFVQLADKSVGELYNLQWRQVVCQNLNNMGVKIKDGSNPHWAGFLVYNSVVSIKAVDVQLDGSTDWLSLQRTDYNYWISSNDHTKGNVKVRVTSILGEQIIVNVGTIVAEKVISSDTQFKAEGCKTGDLPIDPISDSFTLIPNMFISIFILMITIFL